jgi:uracil-DNA glycosylase
VSTPLPTSWSTRLGPLLSSPWFAELAEFVARERELHRIFPPEDDVFAAFEHTSFESVRVVLLGQDPYHDDGQAHGLCFSVRRGVRVPPSLANVFKERRADLGMELPSHGDLTAWAERGVLLLNTVLTVRAHEAGSHRRRGWERFTDGVLSALQAQPHIVFLLWGNDAKKKSSLIDTARHSVIACAHPSPLSARLFFGSRPFSRTNEVLRAHGQKPVDWSLAEH